MQFPMRFGETIRTVEKIRSEDFTPDHYAVIGSLCYQDKALVFPDPSWSSILLGAGEEKAVFCVCDGRSDVR